jgi:hypothetical protein
LLRLRPLLLLSLLLLACSTPQPSLSTPLTPPLLH